MVKQNENVIATNPSNALVKWQLTVLKVTLHKLSISKTLTIEYMPLDVRSLRELGLDAISKDSQLQALRSMSTDIGINPIFTTGYLPNGKKYDRTEEPPIGYTVSVFSPKDIDSLISDKAAELLNIGKVNIGFNITDELVAMIINGEEVSATTGTWEGSLIKALYFGDGKATASSITDYKDEEKDANLAMVKKTVRLLNSRINKLCGISKLLTGQSVVVFNKELYLIKLV